MTDPISVSGGNKTETAAIIMQALLAGKALDVQKMLGAAAVKLIETSAPLPDGVGKLVDFTA